MGAITVKQFTQKLPNPDNKTFLGKGKTEQVREFVEENEIDMIIFDDDLSASQLRNVERIYKCKILDRSNLILDIFASRAKTVKARKLKLNWKLNINIYYHDLTRMWTHLESAERRYWYERTWRNTNRNR